MSGNYQALKFLEKSFNKKERIEKEAIEILKGSKRSLDFKTLLEKIEEKLDKCSSAAVWVVLESSSEIRNTKLGEIRKKYKVRRIFFSEKPGQLFFYLQEKQNEELARLSSFFGYNSLSLNSKSFL